MAQVLLLSVIAFGLTVLLGHPFVAALRAAKIGKHIRAEEPAEHQPKAGTPTMGGLLIVAVIALLTVLVNRGDYRPVLVPLLVLLACAVLGALDDRLGLIGSVQQGLSVRAKLLGLTLVASGAACLLNVGLGVGSVELPAIGLVELGWLAIPIMAIYIVGFANAVNLTDGLDTLAGGTTAIAYGAYGIITFAQGQSQLAALCFTVVGAVLGFLWFNAYPARIFMGDTGALALGAVVAVIALPAGQSLLLPLVGIVFVAEATSVMLQVGYFKLTRGRRLFRMSPLHYHFRMGGWTETQVSLRFWLVGILAGLLGVALALW